MEPKHPQKGAFAAELHPGDRVTAFFIVHRKQLEPFRDRTKGEFLTLVLGDRSGRVLGRVWEDAPALAETFAEGDVVKVAGDVEEYLGRTQLIVQKLRPAQPGEFDLADFLPVTDKNIDDLLAVVRAHVERIQQPQLAALVRSFYDDAGFVTRLSQAPAARRVHHAYLGGLLEHLAEMLTLCDTLLSMYPALNADLLLAGALLHDVGKLQEYTWQRDIDYTDEGRLLGHVMLTDEAVTRVIAGLPDFPPDLSLRLRHMLLSHHGRYEWGSPRRPATLEAIALHEIDNLSAQVNRFAQLLLARRDEGDLWTDYDRLLGRQLYAGHDSDLNIEEASQIE
jgi:3'-5' exoribonuclease